MTLLGSVIIPIIVALVTTIIANWFAKRKTRSDRLFAERLSGLQQWADALAAAADACLETVNRPKVEGKDAFSYAERAALLSQNAGVIGSTVKDILAEDLKNLANEMRVKCAALFGVVMGFASTAYRPVNIPDPLLAQFRTRHVEIKSAYDRVKKARAEMLGAK